jgi:hypothetical protein
MDKKGCKRYKVVNQKVLVFPKPLFAVSHVDALSLSGAALKRCDHSPTATRL